MDVRAILAGLKTQTRPVIKPQPPKLTMVDYTTEITDYNDMPRAAARIFLSVIGIKVEKFCDISVEDATAEGFRGGLLTGEEDCRTNARGAFLKYVSKLYDDFNPNDWCWVYEFERVEKLCD